MVLRSRLLFYRPRGLPLCDRLGGLYPLTVDRHRRARRCHNHHTDSYKHPRLYPLQHHQRRTADRLDHLPGVALLRQDAHWGHPHGYRYPYWSGSLWRSEY